MCNNIELWIKAKVSTSSCIGSKVPCSGEKEKLAPPHNRTEDGKRLNTTKKKNFCAGKEKKKNWGRKIPKVNSQPVSISS